MERVGATKNKEETLRWNHLILSLHEQACGTQENRCAEHEKAKSE